jgi:hypothetical protein
MGCGVERDGKDWFCEQWLVNGFETKQRREIVEQQTW